MAVNVVMVTVRELDVAGITNAVTVGATVSAPAGSAITTDALREADTLPAASFAQA